MAGSLVLGRRAAASPPAAVTAAATVGVTPVGLLLIVRGLCLALVAAAAAGLPWLLLSRFWLAAAALCLLRWCWCPVLAVTAVLLKWWSLLGSAAGAAGILVLGCC